MFCVNSFMILIFLIFVYDIVKVVYCIPESHSLAIPKPHSLTIPQSHNPYSLTIQLAGCELWLWVASCEFRVTVHNFHNYLRNKSKIQFINTLTQQHTVLHDINYCVKSFNSKLFLCDWWFLNIRKTFSDCKISVTMSLARYYNHQPNPDCQLHHI